MARTESKASFLWKNLFLGLLWFATFIIVYILTEEYLRTHFQSYIDTAQENAAILFGIYTMSEIIFGIIPPEFFMVVSILHNISLTGFVINLIIYAMLSYFSGLLGYYIGKTFSNTEMYQRIRKKYFSEYETKLKQFGSYLVFVGAVTPVPFSATCMMAGSVNLSLRTFLLVSSARLLRFGAYGWMVWNFPNWFGG